METPRYTRILRERWYIVVIAAVLGLLAAFAVGRLNPPNYVATATLFLRVEATDTNLLEQSQFSLARVKSYVDLVSSPSVLQQTIDDLGLEVSVNTLAGNVSASNPPETVLLEVTAESDDPREAALIANAVARNLASEVEELEGGSAEGQYSITLDLRIPADNARSTAATQMALLLGLGLLGGLAVGMVVAALVVLLDPRVRTTEDVRRSSGLPAVGQLPSSLRRLRRGRQFAPDLANGLRGLVVNLRLLAGGTAPPFLVLVPTSARDQGDLVRLGLARTIALSGMSVAVVTIDPGDPLAPGREVPPVKNSDGPDVEGAAAPDATVTDATVTDAGDVAEQTEAAEPAAAPSAFARAAAAIRSGIVSTEQRIRTGIARRRRPVPREPFTVLAPEEPAVSARDRDAALIELANAAAAGADTVILIAREGDELPALTKLVDAAVLIVVNTRVTKRTQLRGISTALEFAGVHPAGVVMTSVSARRRRDDLPSTWFEGDRIVRPKRRAGARPRRSGSKPEAEGVGKQASGSEKTEPAGRTGTDSTDLTLYVGDLNFSDVHFPDPHAGEQEAIAG